MIEALLSAAGTLLLVALKEQFVKGRNAKSVEQLDKRMTFVENDHKMINEKIAVIAEHEIKLDRMDRDYTDLKDAIKELTTSVNGNNQVNASLKATIEGLAGIYQLTTKRRR